MHLLHVRAQLDWGYPLVRRAVQRGLQHAKNRHQRLSVNYVTTDGFLRAGGGKWPTSPCCSCRPAMWSGTPARRPGTRVACAAVAWSRVLSYAASASSGTTAGAWDSARRT